MKSTFNSPKKSILFSLSLAFLAFTGNAQVSANFSQMTNAPLLKKISMYSTTIGSIDDYYRRNDRDFTKILPLHASTYRLDLAMGKDDCWADRIVEGTAENRTYNFKELDNWTAKCKSNKVMPYMNWCYIPNPFQVGNDQAFRDLNENIPNWQTHWGNMHADLAAHMKQTGIGAMYHEIYNEPDLGEFFWNVLNNKNYFIAFLERNDFTLRYNEMYKAAAQGVRRGNADAIVGGPALAVAEIYAGGFLDYVKGNNLPLDFFSMHQYRDSGPWPGRINSIRTALKDKGFSTVPLHMSEYNFSELPWNDNSFWGHRAAGARHALNQVKEISEQFQDVQMWHWAMFLNASNTGLGLVDYDGKKKAVYNAMKIFADMPVERYTLDIADGEIAGLASRTAEKGALVVWNNNIDNGKNIQIKLSQMPFSSGEVKVYRIDKTHASSYDNAPEELVAETTIQHGFADYTWSGNIPAEGVIYITYIKSGSSVRDFHPEDQFVSIGNFIKPHYFYYDRGKTFWNHFDEKNWTAYVGSGNEAGGMVAPVGVEADNLPAIIQFNGLLNGNPSVTGANSTVGVQIDFRTGGNFSKSVLFHGGIYNSGRSWSLPWGKGGQLNEAKQVDLSNFNVKLSDYAPAGWDGRVIITTLVQDCGANVRLTTKMNSGVQLVQEPYTGTPIAIPGTVEAENFDKGGEGLAYHDNEPENKTTVYRSEGVDIEACKEGGFNLDYSVAGEWTEYTVNVNSSGSYVMDARVGSMLGGTFHLEMDGTIITGPLTVPATGDWQNWVSVLKDVTLSAGNHILRFYVDQAEFNTNKFVFTKGSITGLDTPEASNKIEIFPNPAKDQVVFNSGTQTIQKISFSDMNGRVVYESDEPFTGTKLVSTSHLSTGIYQVKITGTGLQTVQKLVIGN